MQFEDLTSNCIEQTLPNNLQAKLVHYQKFFKEFVQEVGKMQVKLLKWQAEYSIIAHSIQGHAPLENFDFEVLTSKKGNMA